MQCPNCGATVLKEDVICKKCNAQLRSAESAAQEEKTRRSRLIVLLLCWFLGPLTGAHLHYLGFHDKAREYSYYSMLSLTFWIRVFTVHVVEILAIIGGKYSLDAHGNPVRWP